VPEAQAGSSVVEQVASQVSSEFASQVQDRKVVLLDLAIGGEGLVEIGADLSVPGISELVLGDASFGQVIARDRVSGIHFVTSGRAAADAAAIIGSPRLALTIEALARSYDHVVVNIGGLPETALTQIAELAPQAVLVVDALDEEATTAARTRLVAAGCKRVSVLPGGPQGSSVETPAPAAA
jgi:Mrp family chromosome partitioning ATPase